MSVPSRLLTAPLAVYHAVILGSCAFGGNNAENEELGPKCPVADPAQVCTHVLAERLREEY